MMKNRPGTGYVYTPITRGHKPTPSQESNTLSEVSTTTTISMDSGPISPTYNEEEENRLGDFRDEDDAGSLNDHGGSLNGDSDEHNTTLKRVDGHTARSASRPDLASNLRLSNSNLSERSSTISERGSSSVSDRGGSSDRDSRLSDVRSWRDSCDTVVCVKGQRSGSDAGAHRTAVVNGHEVSADGDPGMSRETKSANSDYGSFCATPTGAEAATPPRGATPPRSDLANSTTPYQQVQNISQDVPDKSLGDACARAPLLSDSENEDEAGGSAARSRGDRGAPVKITLPPAPRAEELKIPAEPLKTLLSAMFLATGFIATTTSLAITHESVPDIDPLPDIVLDNVSYQQWGLDVSEILIMISTMTAFLVVMLHSHRLIILRRVWFLLGCLYYYRAITMFITVLPKSDPSYTCHPKLDNNTELPVLVIAKRVLILMSGMGLSINGKHIYCGDYIFSGHTMVLTMGYLVIREYSPRRFFVLHWLSFLTSLTGVVMLLIARGHYSIDCVIAYYITTRMWYIYHTLAHNNNLKTRGNHNFLDNMWWWLIFRYFETKIETPLPRRYSLPIPARVKKFLKPLFRRCQSSETPAAP